MSRNLRADRIWLQHAKLSPVHLWRVEQSSWNFVPLQRSRTRRRILARTAEIRRRELARGSNRRRKAAQNHPLVSCNGRFAETLGRRAPLVRSMGIVVSMTRIIGVAMRSMMMRGVSEGFRCLHLGHTRVEPSGSPAGMTACSAIAGHEPFCFHAVTGSQAWIATVAMLATSASILVPRRLMPVGGKPALCTHSHRSRIKNHEEDVNPRGILPVRASTKQTGVICEREGGYARHRRKMCSCAQASDKASQAPHGSHASGAHLLDGTSPCWPGRTHCCDRYDGFFDGWNRAFRYCFAVRVELRRLRARGFDCRCCGCSGHRAVHQAPPIDQRRGCRRRRNGPCRRCG